MFTVETNFNHTLISVVDDKNKHEDLEVKLYEDTVEIYQWDDESGSYRIITVSASMFLELVSAMNKPDGAYHTR